MTYKDPTIGPRAVEQLLKVFPSKQEARKALDCGENTILAWEHGISPSAEYIAKMWNLGLDIEYILTGY